MFMTLASSLRENNAEAIAIASSEGFIAFAICVIALVATPNSENASSRSTVSLGWV